MDEALTEWLFVALVLCVCSVLFGLAVFFFGVTCDGNHFSHASPGCYGIRARSVEIAH